MKNITKREIEMLVWLINKEILTNKSTIDRGEEYTPNNKSWRDFIGRLNSENIEWKQLLEKFNK